MFLNKKKKSTYRSSDSLGEDSVYNLSKELQTMPVLQRVQKQLEFTLGWTEI